MIGKEEVKRYWLFTGDKHSPCGGFGDFIEAFDSIKEAEAELEEGGYDWFEIVDSQTLTKVSESIKERSQK